MRQEGDEQQVNARILYWGAEGSGKSTSLRVIAEKLRADHRGDLRAMPTGLDPTVAYEVLPIELGRVGGLSTRIQIVAVPGAPEHAPTRKQLLDRVDGVVFVIDAQRERIDDNLQSFEELRTSLSAYGRPLAEVPLVFQYNKRDLADSFALEELHRKLDMRGVAAFESVATEGRAVLQALTTASKVVVRRLRTQDFPPSVAAPVREAAPLPTAREQAPPAVSATEAPAAAASLQVEATHGAEGGLRLREVGELERVDACTLRIPLTVEDDRGGRAGLALVVRLEAPDSNAET